MPPKDTRWTQFVPRKVYDKYQDRMEIRLSRVREDYRADMAALVARLILLEEAVEELMDPTGKDYEDDSEP